MFYDYNEAMSKDLVSYVAEHYTIAELVEALEDTDALAEKLNDDCWIADDVTGNASGSYTCNCYKAQEYVTDNMNLCREMISEFCIDADTVAEHFLNEDWEYFDVSIRCYLLSGAVYSLVEALAKCREALEEQAEPLTAEVLAEILAA